MKNIYTLLLASLFGVMLSCKKSENLNKEIVGLGGDTWAQTALDQWLFTNFTQPYNISVKYRWDGTEYDNSKTLTPPITDKVQPLMEVVRSVWIDPYTAEAGQNFIKKYAPKNYILVGSLQYNSGGTVTLGEAGGGVKVTLFNVNNFSKTERDVAKRILKTIHHEFTHILNQTINFQKEFPQVTPAGYTADWNNRALVDGNGGFITQYAQASPDEDFAEMTSIMLTEGKAGYEAILKPLSAATITAIRTKQEMVVGYFKQSYGIDFYNLQNRVQAALNQNSPLLPSTYLAFGGLYTTVTGISPDLAGQSADFTTVFNAAKTGLAGLSGRVLSNVALVYGAAGQITLRVNYLNSTGAALVANFTYNIATDANGNINLTLVTTDANGLVIAPGLTALTNYLTQNKFSYKWYYSADFKSEYIGLQKTADANSFFFGVYGN
ncbi:substrate import-associated zinc metallohydrolase lipoprotein [Pedobacter sp. ok626]|uniref:zinc-binding metallopeptidase n=1 Tax=Pedobacter sp. ok626 TaxID=1761882 RepID=UPI00089209D9|nr:putative zinc-binding metallopeptidase [Pedobacter sp. ok626]SDL83880.1 substrate import-associated zinc metallohydrolase lipoprotein [Pedobacter sp. ok626]